MVFNVWRSRIFKPFIVLDTIIRVILLYDTKDLDILTRRFFISIYNQVYLNKPVHQFRVWSLSLGKSSRLLFTASAFTTHLLLEKIHCVEFFSYSVCLGKRSIPPWIWPFHYFHIPTTGSSQNYHELLSNFLFRT